jgi:hypothetical protein
MYNKRELKKTERSAVKSNPWAKDRVVTPGAPKVDPNGYWDPANIGRIIEVTSPKITMQGVEEPLVGVGSDTGMVQYMIPGQDYMFPNDSSVVEYPEEQYMDLTDDEIAEYKAGGYIVDETYYPPKHNPANSFAVNDPRSMQTGGNYFSYAGRPDAKYMKKDDGWYINAPGTNDQYVKVEDPTGKRTKLLNEQAVYHSGDKAKKAQSSVVGNTMRAAQDVFNPINDDILKVGESVSGGGYNKAFAGSGTPFVISHNGQEILPAATSGTYCSGYTCGVTMKAMQQRGMLNEMTPEQLKDFQKTWYGAKGFEKGKSETLSVKALEDYNLGKGVKHDEAKAGDIAQIWRENGSGHSVIFKDWVTDKNGKKIGIKYRSSQPSTGGIGDRTEMFGTKINPERIYLARLNSHSKGGYVDAQMTHFQSGGNTDPGDNALELHMFYDKDVYKKQNGGTLPKAQNGMYYTHSGSDGVYRKVGNHWEVDWNRSGKFQPLTKGNVKEREATLNKNAKPLYDKDYYDMMSFQFQATPKTKTISKPTTQKEQATQDVFTNLFEVKEQKDMHPLDVSNATELHDKAKAFHAGWMNSPMYKKMLNNSINAGKALGIDESQMAQHRLDNLWTMPPELNFQRQPKDTPYTGGVSMTADGLIEIYPQGAGVADLSAHEVSHSVDRPVNSFYSNQRLIPQADINYIQNATPAFNKTPMWKSYDPDYQQLVLDNPEYVQDEKDWINYVGEPTEVRARLNAIRATGKESGTYDPYTQEVTPDIYNMLQKISFGTDEKEGFNPIQQLKGIYSDEQIIEMLNTISKNDNSAGDQLNMAKFGGDLPKAQYGMTSPYYSYGDKKYMKKDGGHVGYYSDNEIEDLRRQGYIVEEE